VSNSLDFCGNKRVAQRNVASFFFNVVVFEHRIRLRFADSFCARIVQQKAEQTVCAKDRDVQKEVHACILQIAGQAALVNGPNNKEWRKEGSSKREEAGAGNKPLPLSKNIVHHLRRRVAASKSSEEQKHVDAGRNCFEFFHKLWPQAKKRPPEGGLLLQSAKHSQATPIT